MINFKNLKWLKPPYLKNYLILIAGFLLVGCEDSESLGSLCKENTKICNDFAQDNWCKSERRAISLSRIHVKNNNLGADKYKLLVAYEGYVKCMELASQIQHIKLKDKTTSRRKDLFKAQGYLSSLAEENVGSNHPHLLFYYWSRESDSEALAKFLALEGTQVLENSTAQFHLATYNIKRDTQKTMGLLYHALELHAPGTELSAEILQTLATIHTQKKQYKHAYIWLRAYQEMQVTPNESIELSLHSFLNESGLKKDFLDKVATDTLSKIQSGTFTSPKY